MIKKFSDLNGKVYWWKISQSKKDIEKLLWAKFQDYNPGIASKKALRMVPPMESSENEIESGSVSHSVVSDSLRPRGL